MSGFKLWIDNDACPVKVREIVFKAALRKKFLVKIIANSYMHPPKGFPVEVITVGGAFDAADDFIAEHVSRGDLVITADIPLADRVISNGAFALTPRGTKYDASSIKEALALRNLSQELRSGGEIGGGPPPFAAKDIKNFAAAFDRLLASLS